MRATLLPILGLLGWVKGSELTGTPIFYIFFKKICNLIITYSLHGIIMMKFFCMKYLDKQCINYKVLLCILPDFELRIGCREDLKN